MSDREEAQNQVRVGDLDAPILIMVCTCDECLFALPNLGTHTVDRAGSIQQFLRILAEEVSAGFGIPSEYVAARSVDPRKQPAGSHRLGMRLPDGVIEVEALMAIVVRTLRDVHRMQRWAMTHERG